MFQDGKLQMDQVVGMDPVLGCLSYECALVTACASIALHRMPPSTDQVIQSGKLDNECIPVNLVERTLLEIILYERCFQCTASLFLS